MKNNYLVVILSTEYMNDFLIVSTETPEEAREAVSKLPRVLDVISVWSEVVRGKRD